ncbi:hypothetical protein [Thalassobacillus hwangdonensis]
MTATFSLQHIAWKRILFFLLLIIVPNYLVMRMQLAGPIDDRIGLATAIDLTIILPLLIYFFGFRKRMSWLLLCALIFWGLILANWMIPGGADAYLSYFNHSVIVLEAGVIFLELVLFIAIVKRFPTLIKNYKQDKADHHHFLLSFSKAIQRTFTFSNPRLNKFQLTLRILATDIAAIYYSLFSWKKKPPVGANAFTFHKDGGYQAVFLMLVHAMVLEIIAVHVMVAQYSHVAAWVITALDIYTLLFIISDYQAIRLSPVVLDESGVHFQKGIRVYGFIPWEMVRGVEQNSQTPEEVGKDKQSIALALHGLEKDPIPYVLELKDSVKVHQIFGIKKTVDRIYLKMDDPQKFNESINQKISPE